jgi:protein TonB
MDRENSLRKRAPLLGGLLVVLILVSAMVWFVRGFMANKDKRPPRTVQNITVIRPPPPPPPEETPPPPPPEKVEQPLPQNEPEPTPDNTPTPSQQLGLDADGAAGDDGFGLAARKGGSDIAGSGGAAFAWYTGKLKDEVNDRLSLDAKLRGKKFSVGIRIWLESDGRIKDIKMTSGTGNRDIDSAISSDIAALGRLGASPPIEMPQPISLQIVSRS